MANLRRSARKGAHAAAAEPLKSAQVPELETRKRGRSSVVSNPLGLRARRPRLAKEDSTPASPAKAPSSGRKRRRQQKKVKQVTPEASEDSAAEEDSNIITQQDSDEVTPSRELLVAATPESDVSHVGSEPTSQASLQYTQEVPGQSALSVRTAIKVGKAPKHKPKPVSISSASELLESFKAGRCAVQEDVETVIAAYKDNQVIATQLLVTLLVQACGCKADVSLEPPIDDVDAACADLVDQLPAGTDEYPIKGMDKTAKRFKANFLEFWTKFVRSCPANLLFDDYLLTTLLAWLMPLCASNSRAFRHTSTLVVLSMIDGFVQVHKACSGILDDTVRQIEAATKKKRINKVMVEELRAQEQSVQKQINNVELVFDELFKGMYVHRFRDVCVSVRVACMEHMGQWMKHLSQYWLRDQHLKYIGWELSDKTAMVRRAAMAALRDLYEVDEFKPLLYNFTERFKGRYMEMIHDVDEGVAAETLHTLRAMLRNDMLDEEDIEAVDNLVIAQSSHIRKAAGLFAQSHMLGGEVGEKLAQQSAGPDNSKAQTVIQLRAAVEFLLQRGLDMSAYVVDSLWVGMEEALLDVGTMCNMLEDDAGAAQGSVYGAMSDKEETALIKLMCCSAQKATGKLELPGQGHRKIVSNKERQNQTTMQLKITELLADKLPKLLVVYGADCAKVECLCSLPLTFSKDLLAAGSHSKSSKALVSEACNLITKHTSQATVNACAKLLLCLHSESGLTAMVDVAVAQLADSLEQQLDEAYSELQASGIADDNQVTLTVRMMRVKELYTCFNLSSRDKLSKTIAQIIDLGGQADLDPRAINAALQAMSLCLLWKLSELDPNNVDHEAARGLGLLVGEFVTQVVSILEAEVPAVRSKAFFLLSDLLLVFSRHLKATTLAPVAYDIRPEAMNQLQFYVQDVINDDVPVDQIVEEEGQSEGSKDGHSSETDKDGVDCVQIKRFVLATFFKLVAYSVIDAEYCIPFVGLYLDKDLGDVVKQLFAKVKEQSPTAASSLVHSYLTQVFEQQEEDGSPDISILKDSARRFALSFGVGNKARTQLRHIHQEGIKYSLQGPMEEEDTLAAAPAHLGYLDILREFSLRLGSGDAEQILAYTDTKSDVLAVDESAQWRPLADFKMQLQHIANGRQGKRIVTRDEPIADAHDEELDDPISSGEGTPTASVTGRKKNRDTNETPDMAIETPDMASETPDMANETPDMASETPDMANETPDMANETPDMASETPDMADAIEPESADKLEATSGRARSASSTRSQRQSRPVVRKRQAITSKPIRGPRRPKVPAPSTPAEQRPSRPRRAASKRAYESFASGLNESSEENISDSSLD